MKKTKLVALGLAAALVVGLFGCAGDKTQSTTTSESTKTSESTATSESKTDEKKVVTIGVMQASSILDWDNNLLTKAVEEQFNVEIEFFMLPSASSDFGTKVTLMATSDPDSMPDMIMGDGVLGSSQQLELGDAGVFQPIEDYVNDPAKTPFFNALPENIKAEMLAVMQQPDGHIYGFADHTANPSTSNPEKMWINTAWIETLKLEVPTTTEELKNVLIAFKEGDPNGNKVQDEIGVYGRRQGWGEDTIACLMNSFVETSWNNGKFNGGLAADQKTGTKVVAPFVTDGWKEGIKYLNDLYNNGVFAASSFTDDDTTYKATINQNPCIVGLVDMASNTWITEAEVRDQFTYFLPVKGPEGYSWFPTRCSSFNTEVVFTCTGEQLDLCVAIQDAMYDHSTPESLGIVRMGRGEYGVDWTDDAKTLATTSNLYVESGLVDALTYAQLNKKPDQHNWNWGGFGAGAPENGVVWSTGANLYDGVYNIETATDAWMVDFLAAVDSDKYVAKLLPVLNYTTDEIDELGDIRSNVVGYVNSFLAECTTGVQDVEKNWDAYLKELDKMGLQTWLDMAQTVLDRQK
jgi:putative aldouronate transport system substrate-binding protein